MTEERPTYGDQERSLADFSPRQIASGFASALLDLTGNMYEAEILALDRRPEREPMAVFSDIVDIRMRVREVDESELEPPPVA